MPNCCHNAKSLYPSTLIYNKYSTVMASNLVVSESLCFTLNKVGKSPAKNVKAVLLDFYNEDEVSV